MQILPAIDIFRGACVRLCEGNYAAWRSYPATPREMAENFVAAGAAWIHVIDLEGAKEGRVTNWDAILAIRSLYGVAMQVGGGVRTAEEVERLLEIGVDRVIVGSIALKRSRMLSNWAAAFGPEKFRVALDLRDGKLATSGWQETVSRTLDDVIPGLAGAGITQILSTDIRRDGTMRGPNLELYRDLVASYPAMEWFASGGIRSLDDIDRLKETGVTGAIVGKAIYEGAIAIKDLFRC